MANEGTPEFYVDQNMYYPTSNNYGYYCTGFETPGEWEDHHRIFGVDGPNVQYAGAQNESLPYVYYSYGYAQFPHNPYNPYIPGAMIGIDGSFGGGQHYYTLPNYQNPVSASGYIPIIPPDTFYDSSADSFFGASASVSKPDGRGLKHKFNSASGNFSRNSSKFLSNQTSSLARVSEGPRGNDGRKQDLTHASVSGSSFLNLASPAVHRLTQNKCSLLHHRHFWITSKRIVTPQGIISGSVEIKEGKIISVTEGYGKQGNSKHEEVIDYGDAVVMPGLIDVHVHLDEPGRTAWEGFDTGTRAAAAGGVTTIVDMPLNNHPTTVSKETLKLKLEAAENRIYVDVGFWGGLIPENALNKSILEGLLSAGVLGLKSFMCPSGISDFPMTTIHHIKEGLSVLAKYRRPLYVHSEIQQHSKKHLELNDKGGPRTYLTYLHSRPPSWEEAAIKELVGVTKDTRTGGPLEGAHVHVAHLSDSSASLDLIKEAKSRGDSISVETCLHYVAFSSEEIPNGDTLFLSVPHPFVMHTTEKNYGRLCWRDTLTYYVLIIHQQCLK